ncbi:GNAT family N-acetyltransferase [Calothrix sp. UHCC 0171]|uniref:GNAT family N-acetyltransferase n=1 Tax=Calothrix sp. UHCC 0171 TaxID=3110245 RepID=UPI002B20D685|nr:GNAT family N-acetyltransferase [Calothrix sp. UHCC 0171]MEA5569625.1 GNAT family N-acetyltransferase [Calothrix sp. UHCC 0171]
MNLLEIEIISDRLVLKAIDMQYKAEIFREFTPEITTYMFPRSANDISETESFIRDSLKELRNGYNLELVILQKDTKEFLGCTGIHKINTKMPEFGIWLKKSAQGNYYGFETITALKQWAEENLDSEGFVYPVDRDNYSSRRIPERLGGQIVKEYDKVNLSGKILHVVEYWIVKQSV